MFAQSLPDTLPERMTLSTDWPVVKFRLSDVVAGNLSAPRCRMRYPESMPLYPVLVSMIQVPIAAAELVTTRHSKSPDSVGCRGRHSRGPTAYATVKLNTMAAFLGTQTSP